MTLWLTRKAVRAVDRAAIDEYGLPGIVLMENAAHALFECAMAMLAGTPGAVVILCGPGNNGGDGYALARLLHNAGVTVSVIATVPIDRCGGDAGINANVAGRMGIPIGVYGEKDPEPIFGDAALLVDALLGTGLSTAPRGAALRLIHEINRHSAPTLAVDLPSGLDCDTGAALGATVRATETVTFVGMKAGFANPSSREYTGHITVGDIGAPRELVERFGTPR